MSIIHYFGKDPEKRAKFIFNLIAPVYGFIDKGLAGQFREAAEILNAEIPLNGLKVLDVGCGTGAWGASLAQLGANVSGVDMSEKMIAQAREKHPEIQFYHGDAKDLSLFEDNQFDLLTASYVLHGTKQEMRTRMLNEMKRIASRYVVVHDFYGRTAVFTRFLEFMERSDYINFKKNFATEMQGMFNKIKITECGEDNGTALYIGIK